MIARRTLAQSRSRCWGIVRIAVRIAEKDDLAFFARARVYFENLIEGFVADPEIAGGIPDRPFRKAEARGHLRQLCLVVK